MSRRPVGSFWIRPRTDNIGASFGSRVKAVVHTSREFPIDKTVDEPHAEIHYFVYGLEFGWRYLQITSDDYLSGRSYEAVIISAMKEFKCGAPPEVIVVRKPSPTDNSTDVMYAHELTPEQIYCLAVQYASIVIA